MRTFLLASSVTLLASCNVIFGIEPGELGGSAEGASGPGTGAAGATGGGGSGGDGGNVGGSGGDGGTGAIGGTGGDGGTGGAPAECDPLDLGDSGASIDATCGTFVDPTRSEPGTGTRDDPYNSFSTGLAAVATGGRIYVCGNSTITASEGIVVTPTEGLGIYGTLRCDDWTHDAAQLPTLSGNRAPLLTVTTTGGAQMLLHGFVINASNDGNPGSSAVAVAAVGGDLTLRDMQVFAQLGANGMHGLDHPSTSPAASGPAGTSGTCAAAPLAGVGGVNACLSGASTVTVNGGNGVGNCSNVSGIIGNPGAGTGGGLGGGFGGGPCIGNFGGPGATGTNGNSAGVGADGVGVLMVAGWTSSVPSDATAGAPGAGGGSGGTCANGASGGGGAGGCGGLAGGNGLSGGASFALAAIGASKVTLVRTRLQADGGGNGGNGGLGQVRGLGGGGGPMGGGSARGGGAGGAGGYGGSGASGPGGPSALLVATPNATFMTDPASVTLSMGALGPGGTAGTPGPTFGGTAPPPGAASSNGASCARLNFGVPASMQCVNL